MKVTAIETVRLEEFPNLLWVHIHTDEGLIGLGETFYGPGSAEAHIHELIAPYLLGQDPLKIDRALESYDPLWVEDPVVMDHLDSLEEVARSTAAPIAVGETRGGRADFRSLIEMEALSSIILDLSWCGGLSEARKIAAMAEAWHVPVAFHDCTGPVVLTASTHLALNTRNCFIQEMVRAFYYGWYGKLVTDLPPIENGMIRPPEAPGLGLKLLPEVLKRKDCHIRRSE